MAKPKQDDAGTGGESLQSRVVSKLNKDKDLTGLIRLGSEELISDSKYYISTQCALLDYAIGQPGIPSGKLTTIFGREGASKSTIVQHLMAEVQRMGGIGILIDSEQRYDKERGARVGINNDELIVIQGTTLEQAFRLIYETVEGIRKENLDLPILVALDSLAGAVGEKRLNADVGDVLVSTVARFVSEELKKLKLIMSKAGVALVIVNQLRQRIQMGGDPRSQAYRERMKVMGQQYAMIAEMPLIFESALMIYLNSIGLLGDDQEHPTGLKSRAIIRKCGISPHEMWRAEFNVDYLRGIDNLDSKFDLLEEIGAIQGGAGGWYQFEDTATFGETKFQRRKLADLLTQFPELDVMIAAAPTLWKEGKEPEREVTDHR